MHFYYFLLLLLVLSVYFESPQYTNIPPIEVTAYSSSSSAHLGILTPILPQHEVYRTTRPHNEVSKTILPYNEVYRTVWPQSEVFKIVIANCQLFKKS